MMLAPAEQESLKHVVDVTTVGAAVMTWFWEFMPHLVLVLAVVWWLFRIYELKTITGWLARFAVWRHRP